MPFSPLDYLRHMLDECNYLVGTFADLNREDFESNSTLKRASVRSLEIIGEASKRVGTETKSRYADVEWKPIGSMRDRLIHDYFGVDYDIVWDVVRNKVPVLRAQLIDILDSETANQRQSKRDAQVE
jgi:uncharacterized protein with HEPN domain